MNATILLSITIALALISLGTAVYTLIWLKRLRDLRTEFSAGNQPENLEEIVNRIIKKIKSLEEKSLGHDSDLASLDENLSLTVQKIGVHRFNALPDEGGSLSFSLALLNRHNSGLVITSLHGRQHNRVYSKPVEGGASPIQLSDEEQKAIQNANNLTEQ
jgi:hypothetical protein